jgi:hypothetical protein
MVILGGNVGKTYCRCFGLLYDTRVLERVVKIKTVYGKLRG